MTDPMHPVSGPISEAGSELKDAVTMALVPQFTEGQSLPASQTTPEDRSPAAPKGPMDDEMAALDTCGKYGGVTLDGEACDRPSAFGIPGSKYGITPGTCYQHRPDFQDAKAKRKAEFLERYMNQPASLVEICREMNMSVSQPYLWKLTDVGFRKTMEALVVIVDAIRNHIAEDAMFARVSDMTTGADTLRMFYHQNRSGGRWRDVRKDMPAQSPTIVNTGSGNVQVTYMQMGDDFVAF